MFPDLNALLAGNETGSESEREYYLVTEGGDADGSFVVHHFLTQYLKSNYRVVFLALAQSFSHYSAVAQKLGVNLMAARTSGQLDFISGLQYSFPLMRDENAAKDITSDDALLLHCLKAKSLQPLYKHIQKSLHKETGTQTYLRTLLLIDDISILYSLGVETSQIADLMQYCQASFQSRELSGGIACLLHCDVNDDEEVISLSNRLQHACTCHLKVEGLPTGFSKDVHGQLTIIKKSPNMNHSRASKKMLQFKITDKNVSFFPVGTSSAVL